MASQNPKPLCLYCGKPTKRGRKGEHIVPAAIGGTRTLNEVDRIVCPDCNSGVLSQLDRELCSRSYLSAIASQEIDAHLWQVWDVDHASNNLLIDARPSWGADQTLCSLVSYPQITFEGSGPDVRGDSEEFCRFGRENYTRVLFKAARDCFGRYRAGKKGVLNFERVRSGVIHDGYRLAPRIFAPRSIAEVAKNVTSQSFVLRFANSDDKRFALNCLSNLTDGSRLKRWSHKPGSRFPTICFFFDIADTMRALMKMGLNLIAAYCPNTPVNHNSFQSATRIILSRGEIPRGVLAANGFAHAEDIQFIKAPEKAHSFRLVHLDHWHVYSSFFGGRIGAYVRVPGPNHETWKCADIVAPLNSKDWSVKTSPILPLLKRVRIQWHDSTVVTPSFKLQNSVSSISIEHVKRQPPRKSRL